MNHNAIECAAKKKFRRELIKGRRIVVGLSGGADSVTLLHLLLDAGCTCMAAHVNHGLRGAEGDGDEAFVRALCASLSVALRVRRASIKDLAKERGLGEEACGRTVRYAFFEELRAEWEETPGSPVAVATAHTLSDNLETLLFRLARGTGPDGLCGIPEERDSIIRPLLFCTREEILEYSEKNGLCYVTDSTNLDPRYARNRIRLHCVPALMEVNSGAEFHAGQLIESLKCDRNYLTEEALAQYKKAISPRGLAHSCIKALHPSILNRVVSLYLRENGLEADHRILTESLAVLREGKGSVNLPGHARLRLVTGRLRLERQVEKNPIESPYYLEFPVLSQDTSKEYETPFTLPNGAIGTLCLKLGKEMENSKKIYKNDLIFRLDYDTIIGKLIFRTRLAGDRIHLPGREGGKLLKKLFSEAGLTMEERRDALIVCDEEGILWAEHIGPSERAINGCDAEISSGRQRKLLLYREDGKENKQ